MEIPEFESYEEELEWRFNRIADSLKALAARSERAEQFLSRGADMIQYKIPGNDQYSNLKEIFDDLYSRINTLEEKLNGD
jgi:uncharacterized protein (DUF2384 family)